LPVACGMIACLVLLVACWRGLAAPWVVGFAGGVAALMKAEGLMWGLGCLAVLVIWTVARRLRASHLAVAVVVFLALVSPWKLTARNLGLRPKDYVIEPSRMIQNLPARAPLVVKGVLYETLGSGVTLPALSGTAPFSLARWFNHLRTKWLLLWLTVLTALVVGRRELLTPPLRETALVLLLQASAYGAVYLASIKDVSWHIVTSLDRLLLQLSPVAWALACALLASQLTPPSVASRQPSGPR